MPSSVPKTGKAWTVQGFDGFENLKLNNSAPVTEPSDYEVLVRFHSASLNYRDLLIPKGKYPFAQEKGVIPGSDGAGEAIAIGPKVTRFKIGAKVVTLFNQTYYSGSLDPQSVTTSLGSALDGTLRQYGTFHENGLVHMPPSLTYTEGSTLSCAALTAWNALYGLKPLLPGEVVLTQGSGGVSIFAIQFAKSAGAIVIATTSSKEKAETLKKLGADYVINYKATPDWGEEAARLTNGGAGADHVLEVGGATTLKQSLKAIKIGGVITIIGFLGGGSKEQPSFLECLNNICIVRGILVGSRDQFEEMNRAIEANKIKPVVDEKIFTLDETKEAYQYMWEQKHFGKLTIKID